MAKKDVMIKDAPLVESINGLEKIPVSDGSDQPKTVSIEQIKSYIEHDDVNFSVDSELSETSENPVQNKVVTSELQKKAEKDEIPTKLSQLEQDIEIGNDSPIVKSEVDNSAVLKGGNNQVFSKNSVALGKNNIVFGESSFASGVNNTCGCRGYYIIAIDTKNGKIYTSDEKPDELPYVSYGGKFDNYLKNIKLLYEPDTNIVINIAKNTFETSIKSIKNNIIFIDKVELFDTIKIDSNAEVGQYYIFNNDDLTLGPTSVGYSNISLGNDCSAIWYGSCAIGSSIITKHSSEVSVGRYNYLDKYEDVIFSIGCGTEYRRKNALVVDAYGRIYINGLGGYDGSVFGGKEDLAEMVNNKANAYEFYSLKNKVASLENRIKELEDIISQITIKVEE